MVSLKPHGQVQPCQRGDYRQWRCVVGIGSMVLPLARSHSICSLRQRTWDRKSVPGAVWAGGRGLTSCTDGSASSRTRQPNRIITEKGDDLGRPAERGDVSARFQHNAPLQLLRPHPRLGAAGAAVSTSPLMFERATTPVSGVAFVMRGRNDEDACLRDVVNQIVGIGSQDIPEEVRETRGHRPRNWSTFSIAWLISLLKSSRRPAPRTEYQAGELR